MVTKCMYLKNNNINLLKKTIFDIYNVWTIKTEATDYHRASSRNRLLSYT